MTDHFDINTGGDVVRIAGDNVTDLQDVLLRADEEATVILNVIRPPRFRETRIRDIFGALQKRLGLKVGDDPLGDRALSLSVESYTMHGCQGLVRDPRDGELYRVLVAPVDSAIWGR